MAAHWMFKLILFLFPFSFVVFTYYLIISAKKDTEQFRESNHDVRLRSKVQNCSPNHYLLEGFCVSCPKGEFSLDTWITCMSWLTCDDIAHDVRVRQRIGKPGPLNAVKRVYKADWFGYDVVYSKCSHTMYWDDCLHGLNMVQGLQGSNRIVQLIGICYDSLEMITAYHPYGSADNLEDLLNQPELAQYNTLETRLQLSLDYVSILHYLHNSPLGTRVMCDTNDITKTLSQYLITKDFHLVLNDVDALPEVNHRERKYIKCGRRQISNNFAAPEQLWPFQDRTFDDEEMPSYDEKIDIWKIPAVVDRLLARADNSNDVRKILIDLHDRCKRQDPRLRPTATEVLHEYLRASNIILSQMKEEM